MCIFFHFRLASLPRVAVVFIALAHDREERLHIDVEEEAHVFTHLNIWKFYRDTYILLKLFIIVKIWKDATFTANK